MRPLCRVSAAAAAPRVWTAPPRSIHRPGFAPINTEQLFGGAWSACYIAAVGLVAKEKKVVLPTGTAVDIEVDPGMGGADFYIQARLTLVIPGLDHALATDIAHAADAMCPYSKATRGNIDVTLSITTA